MGEKGEERKRNKRGKMRFKGEKKSMEVIKRKERQIRRGKKRQGGRR